MRQVKSINLQLQINEDNAGAFRSDDIVESKIKHVEHVLPIVFDRPNNLKLVQKQCLFSLKVKMKDLPLKIVATGHEKAVFRFYLSFSSRLPDRDNYEKKYESDQIILTAETAKEVLREMLKDPSKRDEALVAIRGGDISKAKTARMKGFRESKSKNFLSTRETRETRSDFGLNTMNSFPSRALLTTMRDEGETTERFSNLEFDHSDADMEGALLFLTFRCFSNYSQVMITSTVDKPGVKKVRKVKNEDFFSPAAVESLQASLAATREQRAKLLSTASTSQKVKLKRLQIRNSPQGTSRINLNKTIAKDFLRHKLTHIQKLGEKAAQADDFIEKAKVSKVILRNTRLEKIETHDQKRQMLRQAREKRELTERLIPFQTISISMMKVFVCLYAMKDRFDALKKVKLREAKLNRCAAKIQGTWMIFMNDHLPIFERQRRNLDVYFAGRLVSTYLQEKAEHSSQKIAGEFFKLCHQNVKMKVCFYQSSLYSRFWSHHSCYSSKKV
jgi:hypothetical protein